MAQASKGRERLRVAWLPGDGVGPDVMEAARLVLDAGRLDIEYLVGDVGWGFWCSEGTALPDRTLDALRRADCALMGPVISKPRELAQQELAAHLRSAKPVYASPGVRLRQEFKLAVRQLSCRSFPGNPHNYRDDVDVTVFSDQTEGLFCGVGFHPVPPTIRRALTRGCVNFLPFASVPADELALSLRVLTRGGCEAVLTRAFDFAARTGRDRVTLADKPTVLRETGALFVRTAIDVARRYPTVRLEQMDVDALCMLLLRKPEHYRVIVAESLFGGILGDLCMQLAGGLGLAPTASLGEGFAVFSPYHGPAPRHAGQGKVNPLATIMAAALMLEWAGWAREAEGLRWAVADLVAAGEPRTHDMGGVASTMEVAQEVGRRFRRALGLPDVESMDLGSLSMSLGSPAGSDEGLPGEGAEEGWTAALQPEPEPEPAEEPARDALDLWGTAGGAGEGELSLDRLVIDEGEEPSGLDGALEAMFGDAEPLSLEPEGDAEDGGETVDWAHADSKGGRGR